MQINWKSLTVTMATLFLAASCKLQVHEMDPNVEMPPAFSAAGERAQPSEWWRELNDPQLNALIEQALAQNFNLKSAWDRLRQAQANLRAAGADLWPAVDFGVQEQHNWQRREIIERTADSDAGSMSVGGEESTRRTIETTHSTEKSLQLMADYELDLWGRIRAQRNAARFDLQATEQNLQAAAITLSASIALTWIQLQEQIGQLALLDEQIETNRKSLQLLRQRFRRGQSNAPDVLQQEQLVESRRGDRERVVENIRVLEIALAILTGEAPVGQEYKADGTLAALPALPETGVPAEVVAARPDVQAEYLALLAADQRVHSAIANRYPRFSLTAGYSTAGENWRDLFDNWVTTLAGNIVAPIVDGGARRAEVERTRALLAERFHIWCQTILEALGDVEQALIQERQQMKVIESIEKQLALARRVEESIWTRYLNGDENYLRVLDAQQSVQNLERNLLLARRERIEFRIGLHRALAGSWQLPEPEADVPELDRPLADYPLPF